MNLINVLNQIKQSIFDLKEERKYKIEQIEKDFEKRYQELQTTYKVNLDMNTACLDCEGTGKVDEWDGCDYESRSHKMTCPECNGTGIIKK
jgi:DnaJ-class molecular chaperone